MPKVPEENTPTFSTAGLPGVQFPYRQEFGKQGKALEGLGESVSQAGTTYVDVQNKIRTAQNLTDASQYATQAKLDSDANMQKLLRNSPDGYMYDPNAIDSKGNPNPLYNADGTRQTVSDAHKQWIDDRYVQDQDGLVDNDAKAMYREKVQGYLADSLTLLNHDAQLKRVKATDQGVDNQVMGIQDALVSNPDMNKMYDHVQALKLQMTQNQSLGIHTGPETAEIGRKINASIADSAVQGGWSQEILNTARKSGERTAALDKWISILDGKDPQSLQRKEQGLPTLSDMMAPEKKAMELDKMARYRSEAMKADLSAWDYEAKNKIAAMESGQADPKAVLPTFIADLHNQVVSNQRKPGEAGELFEKGAEAAAYGMATKHMREMSPDQMQIAATKAADYVMGLSHDVAVNALGLPPSYAGAPERNKILERISNRIKEDVHAREEDFVSSLAKPDVNGRDPISKNMGMFVQLDANRPVQLSAHGNPQLAQAAFRDVDMKAAQMHLPADKVRYLPGENSGYQMNVGTLAQQLKSPDINENAAWNNFKAIKTMGGKWSPQILNQMIAQDKLGAEWGLMAHVGTNIDPRTGAKMVAALRTPDTMMNQLVEAPLASNEPGKTIKDFDAAVAKKVGDWAEGMESANPFSLGNHKFQSAAEKGVGNLAKMYYAADPKLGMDQAVEKAYGTFVGDNTHTLRNGPPGALWGMHENGVVNIPSKLHDGTPVTDQEADNAVHFMSQRMTAEGISKIAPAVPAGADESQKANFPSWVAAHKPRATFFYLKGEPMMGISYQGSRDREILMMDQKGTQPYAVPLDTAKQHQPDAPGIMDRIKKISPQFFFPPNAAGGIPMDPNGGK